MPLFPAIFTKINSPFTTLPTAKFPLVTLVTLLSLNHFCITTTTTTTTAAAAAT